MMKHGLQKLPRVYAALHRAYYAALYWCERHLLGTRLHEWLWRLRGFEDPSGGPREHPHRAFLMTRLRRFAPFSSVLEVGCNVGANLVALRRAYPGVRLSGVDISPRAIRTAEARLAHQDIGDASLFVGRADDLGQFGDRSVDVALTDATLMYVGPDKITRAIAELLRVARKVLVLNEWHLFEPPRAGARAHWYYAHWVHDYRALLLGMPGVGVVRVERLPSELWGPGGWEMYGALVEVELNDVRGGAESVRSA